MSDAEYRVVFSGEIEAGVDVEEVKAKLAALFKMNTDQTERLFDGKTKVIKKNAALAVCQKTQAAFQKAGAICTIKPEDEPAAESIEKTDSAEPAPSPRTEEKQIACSGCGNLFAEEDLIPYDDARICAACKPAFIQRLKEGVAVSASALSGKYGSVDKAVNGQYDFTISGVMSEAWSLVSGSKGTIIGGIVCMYIILFAVMMIFGMIGAILLPQTINPGQPPNAMLGIMFGYQLLTQLVFMAISYPFTAGLFVIGIRRSVQLPISFSMIFKYFNRFISLFILNIILLILVMIGFALLVLPGIYLLVTYMLAMPLLVEKGMTPWQALETSRRAISKRWFKIFGLFFLIWLIIIVSVIPLGIGLIWTIPFGLISIGVLYREMFGVEEAA